jgi:hypothetical protein
VETSSQNSLHMNSLLKTLKSFCLVFFLLSSALCFADGSQTKGLAIATAAKFLLENLEVSYVYGGSKLGDQNSCERCNRCLEEKSPMAQARLRVCPQCSHCSLDCSHFTKLVHAHAGFDYPYLTTQEMQSLANATLLNQYGFDIVGGGVEAAQPGDLLVYDGHVVILELKANSSTGDIIHSTGGKDLKGAGLGIQRERQVPLEQFRGPLRRILRRSPVHKIISQSGRPTPQGAPTRFNRAPLQKKLKLRPVEKRNPGPDPL